MVLRQRTYDIDDLWEFSHRDVMDPRPCELIDGELIVMPGRGSVDICRLGEGGGMTGKTVATNEILSGEDVLPGFELALQRLFAP